MEDLYQDVELGPEYDFLSFKKPKVEKVDLHQISQALQNYKFEDQELNYVPPKRIEREISKQEIIDLLSEMS